MERQASGQSARTVLLVGDPEITEILAVNLVHADFEVTSAHNGTEALNKATKEKPELVILDVALPDSDGLEVCRQLKDSSLTNNIPVIILSARAESEDRIAGIAAGAEACVAKPFIPGQVVALVQSCLGRTEGHWNSDPLTGLPNRVQVNNQIESLIRQNKTFAAIYIDIDHLSAFNHTYDFRHGDSAIQLLAKTVGEAVWLLGNPDDFVGHLGNDDFVVITTPVKARVLCQRIIADFDNHIRVLYNQSDLDRGYIELEGRLGRRQYPIMSLSLSVVTTDKRTFINHFQVGEVAAELRDYLRHFPGSNYCFDRREDSSITPDGSAHTGVTLGNKEELKVMHGMLAWITFLIREVEKPIKGIRNCLDSLVKNQDVDFESEQSSNLEAIQENINYLLRIFTELEHIQKIVLSDGMISLEAVDLRKSLGWIMTQMQALSEQRGTEINLAGMENIGPLVVDGPSLTQALFYLLRSETKSSAHGDQIKLCAKEINDTFITIEIINDHHYIPPSELTTLFRGDLKSLVGQGRTNDLHLAKLLVDSIGGKLKVKSRKVEGTIFTVSVPRRWHSSVEEVKRLQSEVDKNGQAVRDQIEHVRHVLRSTMERIPSEIEEGLDSVGLMLRKLEMLCNRSLFLTDDLSYELEDIEERIFKQEAEVLAVSEAILTINREIAQMVQARHLFDLESTKRVAKNVLAIADEMRLPRTERQTLYCAALLKDLELILVPKEMLEPSVASSLEKVGNLRGPFATVRRALSQLDGLAPALALARQRYERNDDSVYSTPSKGTKIPVSVDILAIVDTFDAMISGAHGSALEPEEAVRQVSAGLRQRFAPEVVSAFLQVWKRGGLQIATVKRRLEVRSS